jgi:hypothetical protein
MIEMAPSQQSCEGWVRLQIKLAEAIPLIASALSFMEALSKNRVNFS